MEQVLTSYTTLSKRRIVNVASKLPRNNFDDGACIRENFFANAPW
jgi:hypothetical protein